MSFYNLAGTVNVGADIVGYYVDHTHDDRYYTKAQADAKTMFAVVNANGTLRRGTSGVTSSLFSGGFTGDYTVTFPRSLIACGYVVTAQATAEGNNPVEVDVRGDDPAAATRTRSTCSPTTSPVSTPRRRSPSW